VIIKATAPGRVNLIGEHTDYNQGWVMPVAIDLKLEIVLKTRNDHQFIVKALSYNQTQIFSLDQLKPLPGAISWIDYIKGVCWVLAGKGFSLPGFEIIINSTIPVGAGLSSSAALELAVAGALNEALNLKIDLVELALISQKAENDYVGVRCGIMDQFAVALSMERYALLIDCLSLKYNPIPIELNDYCLLIVDSRVERSLSHSAYNRRREECEEAARLISIHEKQFFKSLREVNLPLIKKARSYLPDHLYRRARYVVEENIRVCEAANALENGDLASFGYFLNRSHAGLRDYFEVSCPELDLIVDLARQDQNVLGARMTGAGFGGCAIVVIKVESITKICNRINEIFFKNGWLIPNYYKTKAAGGLYVERIEENRLS
jgi:galactokinase